MTGVQTCALPISIWLTAMRDHHVAKQDFDKTSAARTLMDQLTTGHGEWQTIQKRDELEECRRRVAELEKELGDAGKP